MCLRTEQLSKLVTERGTTFFIIQVDFTNKQRKEAEIIHMIINWSWTSVRIHVQFDTDTEEYKKKYRNVYILKLLYTHISPCCVR